MQPSSTETQKHVLDLRLALSEARSKRSFDELIGGKSVEEILEAKTAPTWLVEMLEARDAEDSLNENHYNNLLLTSILDKYHSLHQPPSTNTQSHLLRQALMEEAKSRRSLEEMLGGRSLDEVLEAKTAPTWLVEILKAREINAVDEHRNPLQTFVLNDAQDIQQTQSFSGSPNHLLALRLALKEARSTRSV